MDESLRLYLVARVQQDIDDTYHSIDTMTIAEVDEYHRLWQEASRVLEYDFTRTIEKAEAARGKK